MRAAKRAEKEPRTIEDLVQAHRALPGGKLLLAIECSDPRHRKDVVLFEVIADFGGGHVDPDRKFMEVEMTETSVDAVRAGGALRFVLTSPEELRQAAKEQWRSLATLRRWVGGAEAVVHFADPQGKELRKLLAAS